jgi:hypothetical protein
MQNSELQPNDFRQPDLHKANIRRSCSFCQYYRHEEIGDSDFGGVYAEQPSCSKYLDTDQETEEDIPDFDRHIERDCCHLDFWKVLEEDEQLKQYFDKEMSDKSGDNFNDSYEFFKARYNYA